MHNVFRKFVIQVLSVRPADRDGAGGEGAGLRQHQLSAHEQAGVAVGLYTNRFAFRTVDFMRDDISPKPLYLRAHICMRSTRYLQFLGTNNISNWDLT